MTTDSTTYEVWTKLHTFFHDNQPGRAIHIGQEFRTTIQGDMTVGAYCRRLKTLADALADVDEPVSEKTLTLQMIDGLSNKFQVQAEILSSQVPFPSFVQARSRLLLAEIALTKKARMESSQALVINNNDNTSADKGGDRGDRTSPGQSGRGQNTSTRGGHQSGDCGQGGRGRGGPPNQSLQQPWMGYFVPWGTTFRRSGAPHG